MTISIILYIILLKSRCWCVWSLPLLIQTLMPGCDMGKARKCHGHTGEMDITLKKKNEASDTLPILMYLGIIGSKFQPLNKITYPCFFFIGWSHTHVFTLIPIFAPNNLINIWSSLYLFHNHFCSAYRLKCCDFSIWGEISFRSYICGLDHLPTYESIVDAENLSKLFSVI